MGTPVVSRTVPSFEESIPSHSHTLFIRKALSKVLSGNADYLKIKDYSKAPDGRWSFGSENRIDALPRVGNYGIIPKGRLFVLDFDCHKNGNYSSVPEQVSFFSDFFGVDLTKTLTVNTQTGGVHSYLFFPEGTRDEDLVGIPKTSLRAYSEAFSKVQKRDIVLDADIRSALSPAYFIGPTTSLPVTAFSKDIAYVNYNIAPRNEKLSLDDFEILTVQPGSVEKLKKVVDFYKQNKLMGGLLKTSSTSGLNIEHFSESNKELIVQSQTKKLNVKPSDEAISELRKEVSKKSGESYHSLRAFVKASLHCCYSDDVIAHVCSLLHIDFDSYDNRRFEKFELLLDLRRFNPEMRYHGSFCDEGKRIRIEKVKKINKSFDLEARIQTIKDKVQNRTVAWSTPGNRKINPRVLDLELIGDSLMMTTNRRRPTQQILDAMGIAEFFLNPLANVGAKRMVLAHAKIEETLGINRSRASAALRVLRTVGVIILQDKQRTGLSATYSVPKEYTHQALTRYLRNTWGANTFTGPFGQRKLSLYFDWSSGEFKFVATGETAHSNSATMTAIMYYKEKDYAFPFGEHSGLSIARAYAKEDVAFIKRALGVKKTCTDALEGSLISKIASSHDFVTEGVLYKDILRLCDYEFYSISDTSLLIDGITYVSSFVNMFEYKCSRHTILVGFNDP